MDYKKLLRKIFSRNPKKLYIISLQTVVKIMQTQIEEQLENYKNSILQNVRIKTLTPSLARLRGDQAWILFSDIFIVLIFFL